MAEGFITRRGGVSSEQALAPTITFVSKTETQIVFTIKNNDTSTAVILWELDDATPDANSLELAADTTSSNITVTGLDDDTEFIVYATANVTGKVKSNVSELSITTDKPTVFTAATGGTTLEYNESGKRFKSHTFNSSGNFVVSTVGNDDRNKVDYLIIAGGGGGGRSGTDAGAGGGAGGYRTTLGTSGGNSTAENKVTVTTQSYGVTIGAGGSSQNNGVNSTALGITSINGGKGGNGSSGYGPPSSGGSGGGAVGFQGTVSGGSGTANQGFAGGNGSSDEITFRSVGGGGGAGGSGISGSTSISTTGNGGNGLANTLRNGTSEIRAGGGGSQQSGATPETSLGGSGGGGNGSRTTTGGAGTVNTGSGGGGGTTGGAGGSGIVIIRYEIAPSA